MKTPERLATALEAAGAPADMIARAREGHYDDYLSPLAMPIHALAIEAREAGLTDIAQRAIGGEFDATVEEADAWARSDEGRDILGVFRGM